MSKKCDRLVNEARWSIERGGEAEWDAGTFLASVSTANFVSCASAN